MAQFTITAYYLLGGSDVGSEGSWYWTDGSPWSFTAWGPGEPNGHGQFLTRCGIAFVWPLERNRADSRKFLVENPIQKSGS